MEVATKIPLTLTERLEYGELMRIPTKWEHFLNIVQHCDYRLEYDKGEIISFMGYATENHELLVAELIRIIGNLLENKDFRIGGSNLALYIPDYKPHYFNADCTVIKGKSQKTQLYPGVNAIANPVLLVEVLSPSTENHDLGLKFRHYRKIPSLQQVLFVSSTSMDVMNQTRVGNSDEWLLKEFKTKEGLVDILGQGTIKLENIYSKIDFIK